MPGHKKEVNAPGKFHLRMQERSESPTNSATWDSLAGPFFGRKSINSFVRGAALESRSESRPTEPLGPDSLGQRQDRKRRLTLERISSRYPLRTTFRPTVPPGPVWLETLTNSATWPAWLGGSAIKHSKAARFRQGKKARKKQSPDQQCHSARLVGFTFRLRKPDQQCHCARLVGKR